MTLGTVGTRLAATTVATVALLLLPPTTRADLEQPRVKLGPSVGNLEVGPGMNAVGKNLRDSEFVGQDLKGAVFDGCDLDGVRFHQCDLSGASFKGARLTGIFLYDCDIEGAVFADAIINGIEPSRAPDTHLSVQQLMTTYSYRNRDMSDCIISGIEGNTEEASRRYDFRNANLRGAILVGGDFTGCDFTDADISGITVRACIISFDQLATTENYRRGKFTNMTFAYWPIKEEISFVGIDFTATRFNIRWPEDADFTDATIGWCDLGNSITLSQLRSTKSYRNGDLSEVTFRRMDLKGLDLSRQNLTRSYFYSGCELTGTRFEDAVITAARFHEDVVGLTVEQIKSTWNYKHARMEGIVLPKDIADALSSE